MVRRIPGLPRHPAGQTAAARPDADQRTPPATVAGVRARIGREALAGLVAALLLAGCTSTATEPLSSVTPASEAPGMSSTPFLDLPDDELPQVRGEAGVRPQVTIPERPAPTGSAKRVIRQGTGEAVAPGDVIMTHFVGMTWAEHRLFDESWDDGIPVAFSLGVGASIPAWDEGLVDVPVGSRVLLEVAPDKGYGADGLPESDITATDTLVYVVDILGRHGPQDGSTGPAVPTPPDLPIVGDADDGTPLVSIDPMAPPPPTLRTAVVLEGAGPAVRAGEVLVLQFSAATWRSARTFTSTWQAGSPEAVRLGQGTALAPGAEKALVGIRTGSRVLVTVPPAQGYGDKGLPEAEVRPGDTLVYLIDVLGAYAPVRGTGVVTGEPEG